MFFYVNIADVAMQELHKEQITDGYRSARWSNFFKMKRKKRAKRKPFDIFEKNVYVKKQVEIMKIE